MNYFILRIPFLAGLLTLLLYGHTFGQEIDTDKELPPLEKTGNGALLIDKFEDDTIGSLPWEWYNRDGKRKAVHPEERKLFHYSIKEENGNKFLHYEHTDARHLNFPLLNRPNLNIYEYPILSWKWRVKKMPEGGDENSSDYNDVAASIYVVFDIGRVALFKKVPKSIRYTWSTTQPEGEEFSKLFGNQKIVVVESGPKNMGKWQTFQRNIVEDYRRLFGDDPPETPIAILLLSDGDSTNSLAIADYDNIVLKRFKSN
ncbi:DUF3047 domain-containing protein [Aliifodinibius sp. S!AR15-10]|uniref:DUF3047 domain-containing protein n=1 Tax=Aliifodinibius sp. S!AR15-10 TaxID=2950437 RepID=UPI002855707F|nr:DUF3047 domain-containing protein [Aliifodinibius sp. S!AR15-10]MDR8391137.1 DUF3047 domain-containing protein [Aliifodinibius sp. S!AR15-10]